MGYSGETIAPMFGAVSTAAPVIGQRMPLVVVVEDGRRLSQAIYEICDFLEVSVEHLASEQDLAPVLAKLRPMAVLAQIDAVGQDGCHVMKTVADHDPSLPILLLIGDDPALAGAADAVEEIWGLSAVTKRPVLPGMGDLVDFLFRAGQKGHCLGLMPA